MQKRKKILFVESYPQDIAGQQKTLLKILEHLDQSEYFPQIVVPREGIFLNKLEEHGYSVLKSLYPELLSKYDGQIYNYRGLQTTRAVYHCLGYVMKCRELIKSEEVHGLYCNDMRGILTFGMAARSLGVPVMTWDKLNRPHGILDYFQLPITNRTVFISESVKEKFPSWQLSFYENDHKTIPEGVNLSRFEDLSSVREELGLAPNDLVIGVVGTITRRKGQDRLLKLLPKLQETFPNIQILLAGSPSSNQDRTFKEDLPCRNHDKVHFLGQRDDIPDLMHSIDILVSPSRQEGLGLVNLEAMAAETPVIGAMVGGIPEVVIEEETGLLFNDQHELLDSIVTLGENPILRQEMGVAGRKRVEKYFDQNTQIEKVLSVIYEMIEQKGKDWS